MTLADLDPALLTLPAILVAGFLVLVSGLLALSYRSRLARLPDATALDGLREKRAQAQADLVVLEDKLAAMQARIEERDRLAAEAAALKEHIDQLEMQRAGLDDARREIEQVLADAARAAEEIARVERERNEAAQARDAALAESKEAEEARDAARRDADALRADLPRLAAERDELERALPPLRIERDEAIRMIDEARRAERRADSIEAEIKTLETRLDGLRNEVRDLERTAEDVARARAAKAEVEAAVTSLDARRAALTSEVERLQNLRDELAPIEADRDRLREERAMAAALRDDAAEENQRLVARIERLKAEIDGLGPARGGTGGGVASVDPETLLADLEILPGLLVTPALLRDAPWPEADARHALATHLAGSGLSFPRRIRNAFHTALKINDAAQLTVLAGVSGTGKSLLPRKYAEALGIHFLQIAVEPRWDSPQDLLGFHNYVEGRYRATDLARLLRHMDPWSPTKAAEGRNLPQHVAMVLLDEMNVARVEYYFSEFLSRLEARPRWNVRNDKDRWRDARISLDVRGLETPVVLHPTHNILFAGTMNDDESTQALSDKILDRSNVMQFAAPRDFDTKPDASPPGAEAALPLSTWHSWVRPLGTLDGAARTKADEIIRELAEIMEACGRPFGFRLRDAMLTYVANYPHDGNAGVDVNPPLADQVEFRILPKLRGVEIRDHEDQFTRLAELIRDRLGDGGFADAVAELVDRQGRAGGLFVWRGLTRAGEGT